MPVTKLKKILSPEDIQSGERIEETKAKTEQGLKDEIRRESDLLKSDGESDVTNAHAQAGRILSRQEVVRRLKRLNPALTYETSLRYPDKGGIYVTENRVNPLTGKAPWKRFVCGLPSQMVSEFAVRLTVPKVIPDPTVALHWQTIQAIDQQIPGWRSVLLKLLIEGLVTPGGAEREFDISRGRSSQRWKQAVN